MGPRGAGRRLNDQERMEILEILSQEAKVKNVDLAKRYGVSEGAIRKLKQVKDTIRDRYLMGNEHNRDKRKRGGFARNAKFEQELYEWICRMRETQAYQLIPLTQTAVRQQAMLLSKKYDTMATFKASPGWFARFCSRHRLDPPAHHSVSTGGDPHDITLAAPTAAVGDTVPGGPLAAAYQVDPALVEAGEPGVVCADPSMVAAAAAYSHNLAAVAAAEAVQVQLMETSAAPAVVAVQSSAELSPPAAAAAVAVADVAVAVEIEAKPKIQELKKPLVIKGAMPTEDEIFSLGL